MLFTSLPLVYKLITIDLRQIFNGNLYRAEFATMLFIIEEVKQN